MAEAIDVRDVARLRDKSPVPMQDTGVSRQIMLLVGGSLVFLAALKLGFLRRVLP